MASLVVSPADKILQLIVSSFPDLSIAHTTAPADAPKSILTFESKTTVSGTNTIATYLSKHIPRFTASEPYSAIETAEIQQWLTLTAAEPIPRQTLVDLNDNLKFRSTLLGERFSIADVVAYVRLKDVVAGWSDEQRTGEKEGLPHIVRWLDFVQNSEELGLTVPEAEKVQIDADKVLFHPKPEEPVRQKKEKKEGEDQQQPKKLKGRAGAAEKARLAAEAAAGKVAETAQVVTEAAKDTAEKAKEVVVGAPKPQRTEKKQKPKKEPPPPKEAPVITPAQLDLRVGHILYCRPHPNADSLFVSTIAMGDAADSPVVTPASEITDLPASVTERFSPLPPVRTVCSGLNGLVPLADMQDRKVICVANLKPVTMRGIKSAAMVLAASPPPPPGTEDAHKKEVVELVSPPPDAPAGEKVAFDGYTGDPEAQLNPKKKIWEQIQPGFATTEDLKVVFQRGKAGWIGEAEKGKAAGKEVAELRTASGGLCTVSSLKGANVS